MRVLFFTNIEVPYRVEFFNQIAQKIDLTVIYERKKSKNRNEEWAKSNSKRFKTIQLNGINVKNEFSFDLRAIKHAFSAQYDIVVIGCINSPIQILLMLLFKIFKKDYIINLDGECFISNKSLKNKIKSFFIKSAKSCFVAGKQNARKIERLLDLKNVYYYNFSSLKEEEILTNGKIELSRNDTYLVVSQFIKYKGLDLLLQVAKIDKSKRFKIIGAGNKSDELEKLIEEMELKNVIVIPFLQRPQLYEEYKKCKCLILPSRSECWGLVINEAASFGCPIVSTYGSGAAVEFLNDKYKDFLASPNDLESLLKALNNFENYKKKTEYKKYLLNISKEYSIENNVNSFLKMLEGVYDGEH